MLLLEWPTRGKTARYVTHRIEKERERDGGGKKEEEGGNLAEMEMFVGFETELFDVCVCVSSSCIYKRSQHEF